MRERLIKDGRSLHIHVSVCSSVVVVVRWTIDEVLIFLAAIIIRGDIDIDFIASCAHGLLVDALEEKDGQETADVGEDEEHPNVLSIIDVALEKDGPGETHGGGGVER